MNNREKRLAEKQKQFNAAMAKYDTNPLYKEIGQMVSFLIIILQTALLVLVWPQKITWLEQGLVFIAAFILTDFINGVVHMIMDNNEDYTSWVGPLVASFHLHHRTPVYKKKNVLAVYYHESGSKLWLAFFLLLIVPPVWLGTINGLWAWGVFYFAVLSSVAEVSHYLCHTSQSTVARLLGKSGLLLSKRKHSRHHQQDNINYTFLNGMTDVVLDPIARWLHQGYKTTTDLHYANYTGPDTENR